jgi:MoxR-like ATPase
MYSSEKDVHMTDIQAFGEQVIGNLEKVIVGKRQSIELIVIGLLCQGHVLIEDVPGVGKTMLARSLARSLDCTFNRIQFTPDMPRPRQLCLKRWKSAR